MVSRKIIHISADTPKSAAHEAMLNNKEAGAVAAIDNVPLSYVSANFTFNTDNCVSNYSPVIHGSQLDSFFKIFFLTTHAYFSIYIFLLTYVRLLICMESELHLLMVVRFAEPGMRGSVLRCGVYLHRCIVGSIHK